MPLKRGTDFQKGIFFFASKSLFPGKKSWFRCLFCDETICTKRLKCIQHGKKLSTFVEIGVHKGVLREYMGSCLFFSLMMIYFALHGVAVLFCICDVRLQVPSYVMLGIPKNEEAPPTPQHPLSPMGEACARMDLTAIHQILVMNHYRDDEGTNEVWWCSWCMTVYFLKLYKGLRDRPYISTREWKMQLSILC